MTLLMLLLARAYAPLAARGTLIDGVGSRESLTSTDRRMRSIRPAGRPFAARARRHAGAAHAQDDGESLAA